MERNFISPPLKHVTCSSVHTRLSGGNADTPEKGIAVWWCCGGGMYFICPAAHPMGQLWSGYCDHQWPLALLSWVQLEFGGRGREILTDTLCLVCCSVCTSQGKATAQWKALALQLNFWKKGGEKGEGDAENAECFLQSVNHKTRVMAKA